MIKNERITLLERVRTSWCERHRPESESTDWGQSLAFYGLLKSLEVKDSKLVRSFIKRWLYFHLNEGVNINYFCGSWSFTLLYPEIDRQFPEVQLQLRQTAEKVYDTISNKALRNGDGIILHNVDLPNIYIDTVYYSSVLLSKIGPYLDRDWKLDAMHQLLAHLNILRDGDRPLFIHCQENLSGHRSEGAWARGNGWVMMTCAELLSVFKPTSKEYKEIKEDFFLPMVEILSRLQTKNGLWRTILDDKDAYEETSASAMYLFALTRAKRLDVLPQKYYPMMDKIENALAKYVDKNGRFIGVSEGTWPGTKDYYKSLSQGEWWWGTGAYLLALSELAS
jgi:unsaturated rhamnogalacturonyl hydrolase